jgi:hypothetical protein
VHLALILSGAQSRFPYIYPHARFASWLPSKYSLAPACGGCWSEFRLIAIAFASTVMTKHCEVIVCRLLDNSLNMPRLVPAILLSRRLIATSGTGRTFRHWCGVLAGIDAGLEPSAMTDNFRLLASDFRVRAEDIFARAERVRDADIREKMRGIAVGYEKMAQRVEQHARDLDAAYRRSYAARCRRRAVTPIPRWLGMWRHFRRFV